MPREFYVTIEAVKQGVFHGDLPTGPHGNQIRGLGLVHEVDKPFDAATGAPAGSTLHKPIVLTKEVGASSPQLYQALVTNELLKSVLFEFYSVKSDGTESLVDTIKLTNAIVSHIRQYTGLLPGATNDVRQLEDVSFVYQAIDIVNKTGNTSTHDTWTR
jgi:type VI secretion system secreted protein Hcp